MKFAVDLIFGLLFCLSLGGLGVVFFRRLMKTEIDFFSGFFVGCAIAVVALFVGGLSGLFGRTFFFIFIASIFVFVIAGRRKLFKQDFSLNRRYLVPLILLVLVLVFTGLASLSPPIKNDALYYNLGLPKLWAGDGGLRFYPTIIFSATALNSELLLTPILSVVSAEAAQFFVFLIGLMTMLLLAEGFKRLTGCPRAAAFVALGTVPFFVNVMVNAKNDYLAAGFSLLSALFYFDYLKENRGKYILLAGLFAGLAAGAKANALIFILAMFIVIALSRQRPRHVALFLAGAIVFGLPWYLKAYIETGNPFYPFYDNIFHSPYWHDIFDAYNKATFPVVEHKSILNFISAPLRIIYLPDIFRGRLGPFPLVLLPLLFFIKPAPKPVYKALLISAVFYILWYPTSANARYMMPIVPLLCLGAAFIMDRLFRMSKTAGLVVLTAASLLIMISGVQIWRDGFERVKAATGVVERDKFLRKVAVLDPNIVTSSIKQTALPYYDIWQFLNVNSGDDSVVGILCSNWNRADGFYLDRRFLYLNPTEQVVVDFTMDKDSLARALADNRINYVLIDRLVVDEFSIDSAFSGAPGFEVFRKGVANLLLITKESGRLVYITDRYELYKLSLADVISKVPSS